MYESVAKRLAAHEAPALLGLFLGQYLAVVAGPALLIIGLALGNGLLLFAGLLSLRALFLCCDLQRDVMEQITLNERRSRFFGHRPEDRQGGEKP